VMSMQAMRCISVGALVHILHNRYRVSVKYLKDTTEAKYPKTARQ